jgi:hypothetical protein
MSTSDYLIVVTRDRATARLSAAALGAMAGDLAAWIAVLRRWRLLRAVAVDEDVTGGRVRGCLLVSASDRSAALRLAASCPVGAGGTVTVLAVYGGKDLW